MKLSDYVRFEDAQRHYAMDALWALFDGNRDALNIAHECIDRYASTGRLGYIHFRNVRGTVPHYEEVFVDEGDFDMITALQTLHRHKFDGVLIPDHTPAMACNARSICITRLLRAIRSSPQPGPVCAAA